MDDPYNRIQLQTKLSKLRNLAIICHTTELVRGMGLFLLWCHRLICIVLSLCKHACKEVCDVNPGIDPYPLLARSCDRWWPDFLTFTAFKKSRFGLKRGKKGLCVSNRCKDLFEGKKYFGVRCTLTEDDRSFCPNMYYKLKSVVVFFKNSMKHFWKSLADSLSLFGEVHFALNFHFPLYSINKKI